MQKIKEVLRKTKLRHDLIISKADKGSNVIILNKIDYLTKMLTIMDENFKFKLLGQIKDYNKTLKVEKKICTVLKGLLDKKEIPPLIFDSLKPIGSIRSRSYELQKLHKPKNQLRPILSMIRFPQHKIAEYVIVLLKPVLHSFSRYTVKDSFILLKT